MSQYLDQQGLQTLVTKTKEYARKSAKDAVNTSAAAASKTIIEWNDATSAAIYGDIEIAESQVTGLDNDLALKAPLASPAFTGVPTAPKADGTNVSAVANVEYVQDAISEIASGAFIVDTWTGEDGHPATAASAAKRKSIYLTKEPGSSDVDPYKEWIVVGETGSEAWECIGETSLDLSGYKTKQDAYSVSSGALQTVSTISQNANGEIEVTFQDIQTASTSQKGVVELQDSIGASEIEDRKAATPKAVRDAINALDVTAVTVGADKTLVSIGEVDGKIQTEAVAIQIAESQVTGLETALGNIATSAATLDGKIDTVSNNLETSAATLDAKITAVSGAVDNIIEDLDANVNSTGGVNVSANIVETNGKITSLTLVDNSVNATDIQNAINALDFGPYAIPASGTITSISETNGVISVTSGDILISSAQISDLGNVLGNYKTKQTAVSDPTADGTGITFIDSASQDANGVITLHKKTVQSASSTQAGLMSAEDFIKLDGISSGANKVLVDANGVLTIDGASVMGPISTSEINGLFD